MIVSIIVAIDEQGAIGKDNQLLWHLPADMKHFKELTTGHTIIMGRKTFESLPKGALPNRRNIVLTSSHNTNYVNCETFDSLQSALDACKREDEVFIIGGASVYKQAISIADKLYLTLVHHVFTDADTFFPNIERNDWQEAAHIEGFKDDKNPYAYNFLTYIRKK